MQVTADAELISRNESMRVEASARILAICPIGIGNFLLLEPALRRLKQAVPESTLSVLCLKPEIARLASRYAHIDETVAIEATKDHSLTASARFIRSLRNRFDLSLAFFPCNKKEYNLLPFLAGIPRRLGYRYATRRWASLSWLNSDLVPVSENMHDLVQNFALLKAIGVSAPENPALTPVPLSEEEKSFAGKYIADNNPEGLIIGMHPGSSGEHGMDKKRWPAQRFGELARLILEKQKARFLIFGGPEENALKEEAANAAGPEALVVNTKSFFETAALIGRCHRFISNDSGLMHVAVSYGVKTAGLFGPTDDARTAPFGKGHLVIRGECPYGPCWAIRNVGKREECRYNDFRCLQKLGVETVYSRLEKWLD